MPEGKKIGPRPGDVWRKQFRTGDSHVGDEAYCFIIVDEEGMKKVWFGVPWKSELVQNDMVDGQNDWKRVYASPDTSALGLFTPLR